MKNLVNTTTLMSFLASYGAGFCSAAHLSIGGGKSLIISKLSAFSFVFFIGRPRYVKFPSVVRVFVFSSLLLLLPFGVSSCEHYDDANQKVLEAYFVESQGLNQVPLDSIRRFSAKVDEWTNVHPEARKEEIYAQIQQNIHTSMVTFRLELDDSWDDEIFISFDFNDNDNLNENENQ